MGCRGHDVEATADNEGLEMTAFNGQKDYDCDKANKDDTS